MQSIRDWVMRFHAGGPLALLWLPTGIVAQAAARFGPDAVAICVIAIGLPVWTARWWLAWRG